MNEEKIKTYDLNLKLIFFILVLYALCVCFSVYMVFYAPMIEKLRYEGYIMTSAAGTGVQIGIGSGILFIPYIVYLIALVVYKRKNVLNIYENKIEYYRVFRKKLIIEKSEINDIYVSEKLVVKYNEKNESKVINVNLMYIKCDKNEMRKAIIGLKPESDTIKKIISNILEEYNLKESNQLKDNKEALEDCVIKLHNINALTQLEIALLLNTNATKVSKIIRKAKGL